MQPVTWLSSIVTAPLWAYMLPLLVTPVVRVIEAVARMFPRNLVAVPRVALLPTCHVMLQWLVGFAPLMSTTFDALAVVSVLPIWNSQAAWLFPCAFRVSTPVRPADESKQ